MDRTNNLVNKLHVLLENRDFYEATQLYKTLYKRYVKLENIPKAHSILREGAETLLSHHQLGTGGEIANLLLDFYQDHNFSCNHETITTIISIFNHFPPTNENEKAASHFMLRAIDWSIKVSSVSDFLGEPLFHGALAKFLDNTGNIADAQLHYVKSNEPASFSLAIVRWLELAYPSERSLFLTRAVLLYLSQSNLKDANFLYTEFTEKYFPTDKEFLDSPLTHFVAMLLEVLEYDAYPLFQEICTAYSQALSRDTLFSNLLDHIAHHFFPSAMKKNTPTNSSPDFASFFNQLLTGK